jgi:ABC-type ATPase with predicted acetyltransferase domain
MKIVDVLYSSRNDYKAKWQCEQCGHKIDAWGYQDYNFNANVIPNAICPKCGKSATGETKEDQQERIGRVYQLREG